MAAAAADFTSTGGGGGAPAALLVHQPAGQKKAEEEENDVVKPESPFASEDGISVEDPVSEWNRRSILVVIASFSAHFLLLGVLYSYGTLQEELQDVVFPDASKFRISFVGTVQSAWPGLGIISGHWAKKYGHRKMVFLGGLGLGAALFLSSLTNELWQLYILYGVLGGAATAVSYFPAVAVVSHWFSRQRGVATGIAVAGSGLGGMVYAPLSRALMESLGWRNMLRLLGIWTAIAMTLASFFVQTPAECGETPAFLQYQSPAKVVVSLSVHQDDEEGKTKDGIDNDNEDGAVDKSKSSDSDKSSSEVGAAVLFRLRIFQVLFIANVIFGFAYLSPFFFLPSWTSSRGHSKSFGALLLGIVNGSSAIGRVFLGKLGDRFGSLELLICCMSSTTAIVFFWQFATSASSLIFFSIVFGAGVGGYISLNPPLLASFFGVENLAGVVGALYTSSAIGNLSGPSTFAALVDQASFGLAINVATCFFFVGLCGLIIVLKMRPRFLRERDQLLHRAPASDPIIQELELTQPQRMDETVAEDNFNDELNQILESP